MSEDKKGKTYSFDVCSQCKFTCCQDANPPLTLNRQKIIRSYLREQKIPIQTPFAGKDYVHPASDSDGICVFYNKETQKCVVHPVKPETCKAGPVTFDINLKTRKVEFYLKKGEICGFAQFLYDNPASLRKHLEPAKAEIMQLICELDAEALGAILRIPEPQTFRIAENNLPKEVMQKLGIDE
ncbi:MAG: YkgJ family cysteine cluster protein [Candidatus Bathyarchaeota archaeon]|nr:YkgJ family cysteine cluster protein [Candidatus Bathyarchaeota archaeon]